MAHQETLVEWARRQRAATVTVSAPRAQLNRNSLQEHANAVSRELALKNLYVELESMIGNIKPASVTTLKPAVREPGQDRRSSIPSTSRPMPAAALRSDLMAPVLGGTVFMNQGNRAAVHPELQAPTAPVERRRPRPF